MTYGDPSAGEGWNRLVAGARWIEDETRSGKGDDLTLLCATICGARSVCPGYPMPETSPARDAGEIPFASSREAMEHFLRESEGPCALRYSSLEDGRRLLLAGVSPSLVSWSALRSFLLSSSSGFDVVNADLAGPTNESDDAIPPWSGEIDGCTRAIDAIPSGLPLDSGFATGEPAPYSALVPALDPSLVEGLRSAGSGEGAGLREVLVGLYAALLVCYRTSDADALWLKPVRYGDGSTRDAAMLVPLPQDEVSFRILLKSTSLARPLKGESFVSGSPLSCVLSEEAGPRDGVSTSDDASMLLPPLDLPLVLLCRSEGEDVSVRFLYDARRVERRVLERTARHWSALAHIVAKDPDRDLRTLDLLSGEDRDYLIRVGEGPLRTYPSFADLSGLRTLVETSPRSPAYLEEGRVVEYGEVGRRIRWITERLKGEGASEGSHVAVLLNRSSWSGVALASLIRMGCVYVPLDPRYPEAYRDRIMELGEVTHLITSRALATPSGSSSVRILTDEWESDRDNRTFADMPDENPSPHRTVALFFTSGSTAEPRGVPVGLSQLNNRLQFLWESYPYGINEKAALRTSVPFIPSLFEMLGPLLKGVPSVVMTDGVARDPEALGRLILDTGVTRISFLPSFLRLFLARKETAKRLTSLCLVFCAGEVLDAETFRLARSIWPGAVIVNDYGATEVNGVFTFDSRLWNRSMLRIPLGRPMANTRFRILSPGGDPVLPGAPGILHLGGAPLPEGYWKREDLDRLSFRQDAPGSGGERLYNTGDLVRLRNDGFVEYLGRSEHFVKRNGRRVNLSAVEEAVRGAVGVRDCCAVLRKTPAGGERLVVYIVPGEGIPDPEAVRNMMARNHPEQMVPDSVVPVKEFPRLAGGKVDRVRLADPAYEIASPPPARESEAPKGGEGRDRNQWLSLLTESLASLLGLPPDGPPPGLPLSRYGLDSITLASWFVRIRTEWGGVLSYETIRGHDTLESLAAILSGEERETVPPKSNLEKTERAAGEMRGEDVAVIGLSGRFPGASDAEELWRMIQLGMDAITEVPPDRWSPESLRGEGGERADTIACRWGGFIKDPYRFDREFFGFTEEEAKLMDPQQRILLEESWKAMEDAGYAPASLHGVITGVFVGVREDEYLERIIRSGRPQDQSVLTGNDPSNLVGKLSSLFHSPGPSLTVDTACSSSLVALHLACQSLLRNECGLALAAGANIFATEQFYRISSGSHFLSKSGRCRPLDRDADGFVPAEAVGVLILKRLSDAERDGDRIRCVIRGSVSGQLGWKHDAEESGEDFLYEAVRGLYRDKGISTNSISHLEVNGSAILLSDAREVGALTAVYGEGSDGMSRCALSSVKANVGHAGAASGVVSMIKTVLMLERGVIPPQAHFVRENPLMMLGGSPFYVNQGLAPWTGTDGSPRRAALNSFGYGGSFVHLVAEEYGTQRRETECEAGPHLFPLSARSEKALSEVVRRLAEWLRSTDDSVRPGDVARTLCLGRDHHAFRAAFVATNRDELAAQLESFRFRNTERDGLGVPGFTGKTGAVLYGILEEWKASAPEDAKKRGGLLAGLADLYRGGAGIPFGDIYGGCGGKVSLPSYPFGGESYHVDDLSIFENSPP